MKCLKFLKKLLQDRSRSAQVSVSHQERCLILLLTKWSDGKRLESRSFFVKLCWVVVKERADVLVDAVVPVVLPI